MNRTIKFRGKRRDNGEFVYGDLIHMTGGRVGIIFDKRIAAVEVDPDTVAQFVGCDCDGKEVYEGDYIIEHSGDVARVDYHDNPAYIKLCKLEEATS